MPAAGMPADRRLAAGMPAAGTPAAAPAPPTGPLAGGSPDWGPRWQCRRQPPSSLLHELVLASLGVLPARFHGVERRQNGLNRDAPRRNQLATAAPHGRGERRRPAVLEDQQAGRAVWRDGLGRVFEVHPGRGDLTTPLRTPPAPTPSPRG